MKSMMRKTTLREIKSSLGRFMAILAIIALGVGFFSGLRVTKTAMVDTTNTYLHELNLFDYRLISTLGLEEQDVEALGALEGVEYAFGSNYADAIINDGRENTHVARLHAYSSDLNGLSVVYGRLPEQENECVVDARMYDETILGQKLTIAEENTEETKDSFTRQTFEVVGVVNASYYLNYERGTTAVGNGSLAAFIYCMPEAFAQEFYSEIFLTLDQKEYIYSEGYTDLIDENTDRIEAALQSCGDRRYQEIYDENNDLIVEAKEELASQKSDAEAEFADAWTQITDAQEQIDAGKEQLALMGLPEAQIDASFADAQAELDASIQEYNDSYAEYEAEIADAQAEIDDAESKLADIPKAEVYVLTRTSNIGYACFDNDSSIVEGIANVFPLFFFLVAALVCITTMNRMVEEQRTQIGVLKALGYSPATIMGKYMIYSGSAAVIGCVGGFFLGSFAFPRIIWIVYDMMYGFTEIHFVFDWTLFVLSLFVSLLCSIGTTYVSCRYELHSMAAELIRPKSPKNGKRILLERVSFIWKRLKFLHKVSIRNVMRYKKRFFMMILGISGCTALLVTGFGIKDSIAKIAFQQYDEIQLYDEHVTFSEALDDTKRDEFKGSVEQYTDNMMFAYESSWDLEFEDNVKSISLIIPEESDVIGEFISLHTKKGDIPFPGAGEVVLTQNLAEKYHIAVGDEVVLRDTDMNEMTLKVSAICENYFMSYAYVSVETFEDQIGKAPEYKNAMVNLLPDADAHEASAAMMQSEFVTSVTVNADTLERFSQMMSSLDYIVIMVIVCAAALAFIVLYNLTNINITERIREIATIKVLGFYPGETASYVFRENLVLTGLGALIGLYLGYLLHGYVMYNIKIDLVHFDVHVNAVSNLYSILFTFAFAILVDVAMYFKLKRINMAESLKSIE